MVLPLLRHGRSSSPHLKQSRSLLTQFLSFSSSSATASNGAESDRRPGPPPPIRVGFTESAGRGVFATRRIGAGELIHTAKPMVSHPSLSSIDSVCYFCLRRVKPSEDLRGHRLRFCSDECRERSKGFCDVESKVDWSLYHDYCRKNALKYPLLVKRLACMVVSGSAPADCLEILQPASLPQEGILKMEEEAELLMNAFREANVCDESLKFLTKEWYIGVLARIRVNAFRIELIAASFEDLLSLASASVEAESAVGNAVYIFPSFYNHDCDPNAHIIWIENVDAKIKALRDVEEGEELRICYVDASMDRDARRAILAQGFGFNCSCQRCLSGPGAFLSARIGTPLDEMRSWCYRVGSCS